MFIIQMFRALCTITVASALAKCINYVFPCVPRELLVAGIVSVPVAAITAPMLMLLGAFAMDNPRHPKTAVASVMVIVPVLVLMVYGVSTVGIYAVIRAIQWSIK